MDTSVSVDRSTRKPKYNNKNKIAKTPQKYSKNPFQLEENEKYKYNHENKKFFYLPANLTNIIRGKSDDKIKINPYCDNKSFIMWINDILNNSQNNKYSEIKQEIKEMLNKIKKQNSEKIKIIDNILKLKNNYTTLSIFNFSQKKKLKEQISQLEQQLQELSFDDYPDITENLYKYFN